jgi:hypothetical protein
MIFIIHKITKHIYFWEPKCMSQLGNGHRIMQSINHVGSYHIGSYQVGSNIYVCVYVYMYILALTMLAQIYMYTCKTYSLLSNILTLDCTSGFWDIAYEIRCIQILGYLLVSFKCYHVDFVLIIMLNSI